ncbi:hypothetical protein PL8927_880051 [Planktothrix serta PCC 8927]|uniref:Uncharacterized protein n=1 Tax=Planktothrix serta PCC 8927 TaxID=671068 RepID=A0A7Z9C4P5_9CYAN|nr:hypothetical protein [Planktothrix serta]VXD25501.1 hypothetical protein PL8927_880051 [Planktothrix serta PCC 8927]
MLIQQVHGFGNPQNKVIVVYDTLINFDNKVLVMIQWVWSYFTNQGGARLITNEGLSGNKITYTEQI